MSDGRTFGMVNPRSCVSFMARCGTPNGATLDILITSVINASVNGKLCNVMKVN